MHHTLFIGYIYLIFNKIKGQIFANDSEYLE